MDEGRNRAVHTIFKRLYDDGLIYRAERMVNWSPALRSVLSDIEVEHKEVDGELVSIRYGDGDDAIVVATTRVETMLGDTAVAVHPDDERYKHLVGREIELPLIGRRIPIVADDHVDPTFGTGAVKVTPAHDPNDFEIGRRHGLPMPTIMDESGAHHRAPAPSSTAWTGSRRGRGRGGAARAGPDRRREAARTCTASGTPRAARRADRAAAVAAVVRQGRAAGARPRATPCATAASSSTRRSSSRATSTGSTTCTTGASPGSCGGATASRSGTGRTARWSASARTRSRPPAGRRTRTSSTPGSPPGLWPFSTLGWPERHRATCEVLPDLGAGHRLRHPVLLGRPDDDVRPVRDGRRARRSTPSRCTAWSATSTARRCRSRSGNAVDPLTGWTLRHRRRAVHAGPRRQPGHGRADRRGCVARRPQLRHQAVERHPVRADQRRDGRARRCPTRGADRRRPRGSSPGSTRSRAQVDALLEDFQFAKATEALYHFAWDEFCDWYVELAKAQLARQARRRRHPRGARARARRAAAAAAPGHPVHHRDAVDQALTGGESVVVAPWPVEVGRAGRRRGGDPDRRPAEAGHRGPPVPHRAGLPDSRRVAAQLVGVVEVGGRSPDGAAVRSPGWTSRATASRPRRRWRSRCPAVARCTSSSTPRARSTSPPSAPGWAGTWPRRRRSSTQPRRSWATRSSWRRRPTAVVDGHPDAPGRGDTETAASGRCDAAIDRATGSATRTSAASSTAQTLATRTRRAEPGGWMRPTSLPRGSRARPRRGRRGRRPAARPRRRPRRRHPGRRAGQLVQVAGFAEFLAVEAALDKRWPETRDGALARPDRGAGRRCSATRSAATPWCTSPAPTARPPRRG